MVVYLVCFGLSLLFLYSSNIIKNSYLSSITVFIALLFPCILAGLRSLQVGTDLSVYVNPLFKLAVTSKSWTNYQSLYWIMDYRPRFVGDIEVGFTALVYAIAKLTSNFQFLLFIIQCLIVFPSFLGVRNLLSKKDNVWLAMLFFYLTLYNVSLNAVRQFIAMSFAFLGLSYLINNQKKNSLKAILYIILGFLFHKSILISIMIFGIYWLITKSDNIYLKISRYSISFKSILTGGFIVLSVLAVFKIRQINSFLSIINIVDYSGYIDSDFNFNIFISKILTVLPILSITFVRYKEINKIENSNFYFVSFILYFASLLLSGVSEFASRIGYIFQFFNCVYFVLLCLSGKRRTILLVVMYVFVYWWFFFVHLGYNHTVPYYFY